ncbi:arabinogalactan endo-1,4-beta-galactosidase [Bacteroides salyersiae]|nr:arabinogalactan endo-1,4-beta-galactosidase [Bacteroides salyersiae]
MLSLVLSVVSSCKDELLTNGESEHLTIPTTRSAPTPFPFMKGVDLSYANELENLGVKFYADSVQRDIYQLMQSHGANLARIRLWHNPTWTSYSTLDDAKKSISRAKDLGMYVLLDFHYSDTWTDPQQNYVPAAWLPVVDNLEVLSDSVYCYTYYTLVHLKKSNLLPDWVQIGNEINKNIMVRDTTELTPVNLKRNVRLLCAGIKAVRHFNEKNNTNIQTVLHVAMAPEESMAWVESLFRLEIERFDMFGLSYYPQWQGYTPKDLGVLTKNMKTKFDVKLLVAETGHIWTRQWNDTLINLMSKMGPGYPECPCPQLQKDFLIEVRNEVRNNGGAGVIVWEPEWVSTPNQTTLWGAGSNWENVAFFDFNNNLLKPGGVDFLSEDNVEVTFKVDMTNVDTSHGVYITGEFTKGDWDQWQFFPMKQEGNSSIYYFKTNLYPGQTGAYYYLNAADWEAKESIPESCQLKWGDRLYEITKSTSSMTISNVWSSCATITE